MCGVGGSACVTSRMAAEDRAGLLLKRREVGVSTVTWGAGEGQARLAAQGASGFSSWPGRRELSPAYKQGDPGLRHTAQGHTCTETDIGLHRYTHAWHTHTHVYTNTHVYRLFYCAQQILLFFFFFKQTEGLQQPCIKQVYWRHFPESTCLLWVPGSRFGQPHNISDPPPAKKIARLPGGSEDG